MSAPVLERTEPESVPSDILACNPAQKELLDAGLLTTGFSWVLQMPTGSGKTWLAEQAIEWTLEQGYRAVYLTPLRALANELGARWKQRFARWKVGVYTGETLAQGRSHPVPFADASLLILTPERFDACIRSWRSHWGWMPEVELLVVDEIHLLGDRQRGPRLEGTLSRIRRLNPFLRVLGLSATLGNRAELADWLDGIDYHSNWRSVPLTWKTRRFRKAEDKPAILLEEVRRCLRSGGQSLVFVQSRRRAEQLAAKLSNDGLPAAHHHAGLMAEARGNSEAAFRAGNLRVLVSTGTLEMGLNLPVRQVVLYDLQAFDGIEFSPLPVNTVWQRAGRAGRFGLDTEGEVVLLAPSWDRNPDHYAQGRFEPVRSRLTEPRVLAEQILVEVASGLCRDVEQLNRATAHSLASVQQQALPVAPCVRTMLEAGMLTEVPDEREPQRRLLKATRLGRIAVRQLLAPESVLHLARQVNEQSELPFTFFDLLLLATTTPDCEPLLPADFEELDALAAQVAQEPSRILQAPTSAVAERLGLQGRRLLAAVKTALVARAWTRDGDATTNAEAFGCYPFEVRRLAESLERILTSLVAILSPPSNRTEQQDGTAPPTPSIDDHVPVLERARALLAMVKHGVNEEAITLTYVAGIGGTLARRLHAAGIEDIESLAQAEPAELAAIRGISATRAERWIEQASEMLPQHSAWRLREQGPAAATMPGDWPVSVDPYRLGRAQELRVIRAAKDWFRVTGGLEPHDVARQATGFSCDCPDHRSGRTCKHILAVRLFEGDTELTRALERLHLEREGAAPFDLFALWFDQRRETR